MREIFELKFFWAFVALLSSCQTKLRFVNKSCWKARKFVSRFLFFGDRCELQSSLWSTWLFLCVPFAMRLPLNFLLFLCFVGLVIAQGTQDCIVYLNADACLNTQAKDCYWCGHPNNLLSTCSPKLGVYTSLLFFLLSLKFFLFFFFVSLSFLGILILRSSVSLLGAFLQFIWFFFF